MSILQIGDEIRIPVYLWARLKNPEGILGKRYFNFNDFGMICVGDCLVVLHVFPENQILTRYKIKTSSLPTISPLQFPDGALILLPDEVLVEWIMCENSVGPLTFQLAATLQKMEPVHANQIKQVMEKR